MLILFIFKRRNIVGNPKATRSNRRSSPVINSNSNQLVEDSLDLEKIEQARKIEQLELISSTNI